MQTAKQNQSKRVQAIVDAEVADQAEKILSDLGVTPTNAINMFYRQIIIHGGLPFGVVLSERQRATHELLEATKNQPVQEIKTQADLEKFIANGD
ncbi:type II toxin-antitoxin system RelB/DinJ family antitoxin [Levilactobacillus parabrevis]|uniref:type II toxin-antitoxin system RelB/DinJ family antitoxin n=1 Tax=Levilactobacillus parabrevis TaxID=357278 RepID=UPI0021A60417|nr:type II toxin-antitoxin system RelB/DinJ family antitoxin [Levilactobacillus parabrevis]MCT4487922.1 type II toxin-antitoxin system RelB/DinJ family antitoxin [Levilactobacillus parabrevis]MCT4489322.1 type II toxin-antitoxin system RelB/DinJ family antitoxin [Levilactobacillus parabrevis]